MANVFAVHSVGASLATYLTNTYPESLRSAHPCSFGLLSSTELDSVDAPDAGTRLTLFLYRVSLNEHLRTAPHANGTPSGIPLSLDLHYLMSIWTANALAEQTILTWAMRQLHQHPVLDRSVLSAEAGWQTGDVIQVLPEELGTDEMMNLWEAFNPSYRLSMGYVARVVRVDADPQDDALPVVATRFSFAGAGPA